MKKLSPAGLLVIAAVMSLVCGFLVYGYLQDASPEPQKRDESTIVVAAKDIAVGTKLDKDMVILKTVPKEFVQEGAIKSLEQVIGKQIKMPVSAGDQITEKRLKGNENTFVKMIPPDKRALTLGVNDTSGVAGFIRPAMYVDIVGIIPAGEGKPAMSRLIVQNLYVLAVGASTLESSGGKQSEGKEAAQQQRTVTVAISPEDAVKVEVAQQEGRIDLMLRPEKPTKQYASGVFASGTRGIKEQQRPPAPVRQTPPPMRQAPPPMRQAPPTANKDSEATAVPGSRVTVIRGTKVGR